MIRLWITVLSALLPAVTASGINVGQVPLGLLAPGVSLPSMQLLTDKGQPFSLPISGRYLLWLISSELIQHRFAYPEVNKQWPSFTQQLQPFTQLGRGYVVVFPNFGEPVDPSSRLKFAKLFPYTTLFEQGEIRQLTAVHYPDSAGPEGSFTDVAGLYFIESGKIVARYPFRGFGEWSRKGVESLIVMSARGFLAGRGVGVMPAPLRVIGSRIPDGVHIPGHPSLILRLSGFEDQATKPVEIKPNSIPEAGAFGKQLLEALTPLLKKVGVQGIGLIDNPEIANQAGAVLSRLKQRFPYWKFVYLSSPELRLRWLETPNAWVIDRGGRVLLPLSLSIAEADRQMDLLETALNKAKGK